LVAGPHAKPYLRGAAAAKQEQEQEAKANGGDGGKAAGYGGAEPGHCATTNPAWHAAPTMHILL